MNMEQITFVYNLKMCSRRIFIFNKPSKISKRENYKHFDFNKKPFDMNGNSMHLLSIPI